MVLDLNYFDTTVTVFSLNMAPDAKTIFWSGAMEINLDIPNLTLIIGLLYNGI